MRARPLTGSSGADSPARPMSSWNPAAWPGRSRSRS